MVGIDGNGFTSKLGRFNRVLVVNRNCVQRTRGKFVGWDEDGVFVPRQPQPKDRKNLPNGKFAQLQFTACYALRFLGVEIDLRGLSAFKP